MLKENVSYYVIFMLPIRNTMHSSSEGQICNMLDLLRIDLIVKFMTQALKKEYIQRQKQTIYIFVSLLYHFQNVVMCTMWIMKLQISTSFVLSLTQFCLRPIRWRYRCTLNGQVFP